MPRITINQHAGKQSRQQNSQLSVLQFVLSSTDALNRQTASTYDGNGKVLSVTRLAGTSGAVTTTYTYDPVFGDVATVTDPLGHTSTVTYDAAGRPSGATDALGHHTAVTVNGAGQMTSTTDALSHMWQVGYIGGSVVWVVLFAFSVHAADGDSGRFQSSNVDALLGTAAVKRLPGNHEDDAE